MAKRSATALYGDIVIARTTRAVLMQREFYFPRKDIFVELVPSKDFTFAMGLCIAFYLHVNINDRYLRNGAWTTPLPLPLGWDMRNRVAFRPDSGIVVVPGLMPDGAAPH
ncbi:DUF427 domain-containing protein [Devriesea agamarum]|uniref:DUF427 domain-containing protein n=1 Tax=Devriesea agamarum TaxID=472569 RepID=UPI00155E9948|nr:DUF427 domain-containing protein [Devriesea agamarum]